MVASGYSSPVILAHRGNLRGPDISAENSLKSMRDALKLGFGVETDLRRDASGKFYIAHDPQPWKTENDFEKFAALFCECPSCTIAMNVKELGYEKELIALQLEGKMGARSF